MHLPVLTPEGCQQSGRRRGADQCMQRSIWWCLGSAVVCGACECVPVDFTDAGCCHMSLHLMDVYALVAICTVSAATLRCVVVVCGWIRDGWILDGWMLLCLSGVEGA